MPGLRLSWVLVLLTKFCALCVASSANEVDDAIVTVTQGRVAGTIMKSRDGKSFYAFRGIPYARPPVGDLRFKVSDFYFIYLLNGS